MDEALHYWPKGGGFACPTDNGLKTSAPENVTCPACRATLASVSSRWPRVGDLAVEYRASADPARRSRVGDTVAVREVTDTIVVTSDWRKYDRRWMTPLNEGRYSGRRLMPVGDPRVITARGVTHLMGLSHLADNLSLLDHRTPESVVAALAQIITTANESRVALLALMAEASRAEQESNR